MLGKKDLTDSPDAAHALPTPRPQCHEMMPPIGLVASPLGGLVGPSDRPTELTLRRAHLTSVARRRESVQSREDALAPKWPALLISGREDGAGDGCGEVEAVQDRLTNQTCRVLGVVSVDIAMAHVADLDPPQHRCWGGSWASEVLNPRSSRDRPRVRQGLLGATIDDLACGSPAYRPLLLPLRHAPRASLEACCRDASRVAHRPFGVPLNA